MSKLAGTLYTGKDRKVLGSVVINDAGRIVFTGKAKMLERYRPEGYAPTQPIPFVRALARTLTNAPYMWFELPGAGADRSRMTQSPRRHA